MDTVREYVGGDRYRYDFKLCTPSRGWAQVDSDEDASYYGTWANPHTLKVCSFMEGDLTVHTCTDGPEFARVLREDSAWHVTQGCRPMKIDPLGNAAIIEAFQALGLGDMLH